MHCDFSEGLTHPSLFLCRPKGLLAEGRELRAKGFSAVFVSQPSKLSQPSKPYFPRGLRTHRYYCDALKGFWQRAESEGFILVVHKKPGFLRYSLLVGREIKREKWLTGRSTFRK